ncbi:MAG: phosphate/phosphite/phosphonate ABC transporter substrate-binding protein [Sphaerospermopsis sp. SIO1G2]|nr:phosphate/phosphite/phosphonate ABC transporter substrate-binding protein [Sphaerospermopsis sp. SIO1G1]NET74253.1 phosphate/phosphite/phosphonate ABC transporter substrate-binding protein [Sphaerospermopsis sp. SIO1G2]
MNNEKVKVSKKSIFAVGGALAAIAGLYVSTLGGTAIANPTLNQQKSQLIASRQKLTEVTMAFPSRKDAPELQNQVKKVTNFLSKELGIKVKGQISSSSAATVEAMRRNTVDIAFLSSRPAAKAAELANARLHLAEVRPKYSSRYTYCSIFVVRKDSPLQATRSAKANLEQLRGKRIAFTSPTSSSGYLYPMNELVKQRLVSSRDRVKDFFSDVSYGGSYTKAAQAVIRGRADVAAMSEYAQFPPYLSEQEGNQIRVLHRICGVPAHGVVFNDEIPVVWREKIIQALQKLNKPENNKMLRDLYNSTELVRVDHNRHLKLTLEAQKRLGMD